MPTATLPDVLAFLDRQIEDSAEAVRILSADELDKDDDPHGIGAKRLAQTIADEAEVGRMLTAAHALLQPTLVVRQAWRWMQAWVACETRWRRAYQEFLPRWLPTGELVPAQKQRDLAAEGNRIMRRWRRAIARAERAQERLFAAVDAWQRGL